MESIQNRALSTSFLSAAQATDSTCKGCTPKSAATKKLRQTRPVSACKSQKTSRVLAVCSKRLVKWWPAGRIA
ncbi:MAG TPA: hypothetical protein DEB40_01755 [Elusimicrobia bacterium]|nr:hypothetical protein [Elusimicrobiota bacterium]HBT60455.1 hypothetical protein [Elusimicrobiota bacterium]